MTVGEIRSMIKGCKDNENIMLLLEKNNGKTEWSRIKGMATGQYVSIGDCIKVLRKFCDRQEEDCFNCPLFEKNCCHIPIIQDFLSDDVLNFSYNLEENNG